MPAVRIADTLALSVLLLGDDEALAAEVRERFPQAEIIVLPIDRGARLHQVGSALNRAVDEAAHPWILLLRAGESIRGELGGEIIRAIGERARAWGYRLRVIPWFEGSQLRCRVDVHSGEIRLFHRRHGRFTPLEAGREVKVQGSVVRLDSPLLYYVRLSGAGAESSGRGAPPLLRRLGRFIRSVAASPRALTSMATLRYLWIVAASRS